MKGDLVDFFMVYGGESDQVEGLSKGYYWPG